MSARLLRPFPNCPQLFRSQQVLLTPQRLLGPNQVLERDHAHAPAEELDLHRTGADALEFAYAQNGVENVDRPELGLEIEIADRDARIGVGEEAAGPRIRRRRRSRRQRRRAVAAIG